MSNLREEKNRLEIELFEIKEKTIFSDENIVAAKRYVRNILSLYYLYFEFGRQIKYHIQYFLTLCNP